MRKQGNSNPTKGTPFRRVRADHRHESAQDYVEVIAALAERNAPVRLVDVATALGVSSVTASRILARLARQGLVTRRPYRPVELTQRGRDLAREQAERHETVVNFLLALGVPKNIALLDAEGIEHHVSPATLERMRALARILSGSGSA